MSVRLSICIPTYNRSGCLRECLASVVSSAEGYQEQIEILVSDNASADETMSVVSEYQNTYPWIRYHRNDENIGGERNFYAAAGMASGEYVWIFGDDDKMTGDAIGVVIDRIESGYNLIITNYSIWLKDFSSVIKHRGLPFGKDEVFDNPNEFMKRFGLHIGYITSVITKKSVFLSLPPDEYEPYIEYGYPQVFSVYAGIAQNCRATYISTPLVCSRSENSSDYDKYKYFAVGSTLVFKALLKKGYSQSAVYYAKHQVLKDLLILDIITRKLDGRSVRGIFGLMLPLYKKNGLFWYGAVPALCAPRFFVHIARKFVRAMRSGSSHLNHKALIGQ